MEPLLERVAFSVGDVGYRWSDAVLAGALWGEWSAVVDRARAGLAAMELEAAAESSRVGDDEIDAAADEFRYARHLVSAEDAELWLERWDLDADRWVNWIWVDLLRRRLLAEDAEALAAAAAAVEADDDELDEAIRTEAICSGALQRLSQRLAARVAIAGKLVEEEAAAGTAAEPDEVPLPEIDAASLLPSFPADGLAGRLRALAALDRAFERFRALVVTPEALSARVRSQQADWMRISCRILVAASEDVAREAMAAIVDDGEEMAEVAADARAKLDEGTFYVEELDPGLRDRLLPAQPGELLGPIAVAGGFAVVRVLGKVLAAAGDEAIDRRAEARLMEVAVAREVDNRIAWRVAG